MDSGVEFTQDQRSELHEKGSGGPGRPIATRITSNRRELQLLDEPIFYSVAKSSPVVFIFIFSAMRARYVLIVERASDSSMAISLVAIPPQSL